MVDYYIYTLLYLEYDALFDPETIPIRIEECELRYNQELPEDSQELIFSDGKWTTENHKNKYQEFISRIFIPERIILQRIIHLYPIKK